MTTAQQTNLVFFNSYGLIFDDRIYLQRENALLCLYVENLKSIKLTKTREKKINIFSLLLSISILSITNIYFEDSIAFIVSSYIVGAVILLVSFSFKKYLYTIVILTKTNDFTTIKVNNNLKNSARELIDNINKKLKENDRFLRVG